MGLAFLASWAAVSGRTMMLCALQFACAVGGASSDFSSELAAGCAGSCAVGLPVGLPLLFVGAMPYEHGPFAAALRGFLCVVFLRPSSYRPRCNPKPTKPAGSLLCLLFVCVCVCICVCVSVSVCVCVFWRFVRAL